MSDIPRNNPDEAPVQGQSPEQSAREKGKPRIKIRPFEPKDQKGVEELIARSREEETGVKGSEIKARYKENIQKTCQRFDNENFWVADNETINTIIGTTGLRFLKDGVGQIIRVGVDKPFRREEVDGRRISDRMIDVAVEFARAKGYIEIYLTTETDDRHKPARALYERHGFNQVGIENVAEDVNPLLLDADDIAHINAKQTTIYKLNFEPQQPK